MRNTKTPNVNFFFELIKSNDIIIKRWSYYSLLKIWGLHNIFPNLNSVSAIFPSFIQIKATKKKKKRHHLDLLLDSGHSRQELFIKALPLPNIFWWAIIWYSANGSSEPDPITKNVTEFGSIRGFHLGWAIFIWVNYLGVALLALIQIPYKTRFKGIFENTL